MHTDGWIEVCSDVGVTPACGLVLLLPELAPLYPSMLNVCACEPADGSGVRRCRSGVGERESGRPIGVGLWDIWLALPACDGVPGG
jgi:hypothetical protein